MYHRINDASCLTSDLCSLTSSARAGSSTVREHSADIRATVVRLHLGLLTAIRRERERSLRRANDSIKTHPTDNRGRGVTAASRTFNPVGVGSNPADLMEEGSWE